MKNAMIPNEFQDATFDGYTVQSKLQQTMKMGILEYLDRFDEIKGEKQNSFGFIAVFGEKRLREVRDHRKRAELKQKHNNFGLGKTHLQVAAAKELIRRGYQTLIISDVMFMEELSSARGIDDQGERLNGLLGGAIHVPVLVWDDIGKAKSSPFRTDMYYQIVNERYRNRRPILFSSNEDTETLAEKIGDAAASRLFGMARDYLYEVEGEDQRMKGA
jgi:DNA replication protein DnaC